MYLLKRGKKAAKQGRLFNFSTMPNQNPIQQPWSMWGNPDRPHKIEGGQLVLQDVQDWLFGNETGGLSNEYIPLTSDWAIEFNMGLSALPETGNFQIFFDRPWSDKNTAYARKRIKINWDHWTTGDDEDIGGKSHHYGIRIYQQNLDDFLAAPPIATITSTLAFLTAYHTYKIRFIADQVLLFYIDGVVQKFLFIAPEFRPVPARRGFNLVPIKLTARMNWFHVYDQVTVHPAAWANQFVDGFNRGDGPPGNGWTTVGANVVVRTNTLSIASGFLTDGSRGAWRSSDPLPTGNMRLSVIFGGVLGVNGSLDTAVVGRMNSAGNIGISFNFYQGAVYISKFTGSLSSPGIVDLGQSTDVTIANDVPYYCYCFGDEAWVENSSGALIAYAEGINAHSPETNRYYGTRFRRGSFANSASINDFAAAIPA
jgi:hypothetical protein